MNKYKYIISLLCAVCVFLFSSCGLEIEYTPESNPQEYESAESSQAFTQEDESEGLFGQSEKENVELTDIPEFSDSPFVVINNNIPDFTDDEITHRAYEKYSPLDYLGRCGVVKACLGREIMPTTERGSIGQVKPSGWQTIRYDFVDGRYLYNRCHLIGWQLSGENANECNLITGTRYMNVEGMLPFENMVADYIKETNNHVMYRVTPIFEGDNLVAGGVQIEALSVEDDGEGICFNVYCYNNQPGIVIDYSDGTSVAENKGTEENTENITCILNTNSQKFHKTTCSSVGKMSDSNKEKYTGDRQSLIDRGYTPCGYCNP